MNMWKGIFARKKEAYRELVMKDGGPKHMICVLRCQEGSFLKLFLFNPGPGTK